MAGLADAPKSEWSVSERPGMRIEDHQQLVKLNLQAHQSATACSDEFVLEAPLKFEKPGVLVHELLAIGTWKQSVCLLASAQHVYALLSTMR
ncbi:unnamed protein product [Discosporangium mesarthrocarpum]